MPRQKNVAPTDRSIPAVAKIDGSLPYGPQVKPLRLYLGLTLREVVERGGHAAIENLSHWENCSGPYRAGGGSSTETLYAYLRALGVGRVEIITQLNDIGI